MSDKDLVSPVSFIELSMYCMDHIQFERHITTTYSE